MLFVLCTNKSNYPFPGLQPTHVSPFSYRSLHLCPAKANSSCRSHPAASWTALRRAPQEMG